MPTTKQRINLVVDDLMYQDIVKLRQIKRAPSIASVVIDLAKEALELREDLFFAKIADEREKEASIPHKQFWKNI